MTKLVIVKPFCEGEGKEVSKLISPSHSISHFCFLTNIPHYHALIGICDFSELMGNERQREVGQGIGLGFGLGFGLADIVSALLKRETRVKEVICGQDELYSLQLGCGAHTI